MARRRPIIYNALMLTAVNLLLRFVGTGFQVYISATLGAAGVGLMQLVMSVGSMAMVAGTAGVRTGTMYLTAEELGHGRAQQLTGVLGGCLRYSVVCSGAVAAALYLLSPVLARQWIRDFRTVDSLRLFAVFLPVSCLCGVMTGYFTGAGRISTLAAVEVAEQLCSMAITVTALRFWAGGDPGRSCMSMILGSSLGAVLTLWVLALLRLRESSGPGTALRLRGRLLRTAVPLALADDLKTGINTAENLMVPRRLAACDAVSDPLAAFGLLSGMVFPVLMFPACILYSLAELLIPEMARCAAAGQRGRIQSLSRRSLRIALLYGLLFGGLEYLLAQPLCDALYHTPEAGQALRRYAILIPMLYCDCITDAINKGLGEQRRCVRINILTSALDVALLYLLLPRLGMGGYFISFAVTHALNFLLSLRLLLRSTGQRLPLGAAVPALAAGPVSVLAAMQLPGNAARAAGFCGVFFSLLFLLGVTKKTDLRWLRALVRR